MRGRGQRPRPWGSQIPLVPGERQGLGQTGAVLGLNLSPARQAGDLRQALNLSEHQSL